MVDEMLRAAKERRRNRALGGLVVGTIIGSFVFVNISTGLLGGCFLWLAIWILESREVWRVQQIQKPWRNG